MKKLLSVLFLVSLLSVFSFAQGTTGELHGVVKTADGQIIPGAMVTALHKSGQKKIAMTNENGKFKLANLAPGAYTVTVELEGFKKATQKDVQVSLSKVTTLNIAMQLGTINENITVEGKAAAVDIVNSSVSTNIDKKFFDGLPKNRGYQSFIMMAPSVQEDPYGQSFAGATGVENMFVIDGVNVTDVELGGGDDSKTTNVVYEFIEEVEVKNGGYEAEYAGALGGVVNIITKSGGNEYHGSVIANYAAEAFVGDRKVTYWGVGAIDADTQYDLGFGIGGYIVKDKLWFFAAATPTFRSREWTVTNAYTNMDQSSEQTDNTFNFSGKLTFALAKNHVINLSVFGDPRLTEGGRLSTLMDPNRDHKTKENGGTYNFSLKYEGSFGSDLYASLMIGKYMNEVTIKPLSGDTNTPAVFVNSSANGLGYPVGYSMGGFGYMSDPNTTGRWTIKADITKFWGNHTIKAGFNFYKATLDSNDLYTGGYYTQLYGSWWRQRYRTTSGDAFTDVMALYIQDSISIGRLHLNLGIRAESQSCHGTDPNLNFEPHYNFFNWGFGDQIAPRLGFSYDIFGDFTTKVFGSYARYFEMIPLDMNSRTFGNEYDKMWYFRYPYNPAYTKDSGMHFTTRQYGLHPSLVQDGIKPPYQEEFILGFERQLNEDLSLSIRGVYKRLGRIVEDGSFDGGSEYFLFNPGDWVPDVTIPEDYLRAPEEYRTFPKANRTYKAVEVVFKKRFSNNWQALVSYTYGRAKGNINGLAFEEYGQVDPNITAAFDFPELLYNADGYLPTDIKHALKVDGSYVFDFGLNVGLSMRYRSGRPYTDMGENMWYGYMAYLDQRGTSGRLPSMFTADIHLSYTFKLGGNKTLSLFTDIFNVTNNTKMTRMYTRYDNVNFYGFSDDPTTIMPEWTKPASPSHPDYGKATRYNLPIRATFGVKFEF